MSALSPGVTTRTIAIRRTPPWAARSRKFTTFRRGVAALPSAELQQLLRDRWPGALHEVAEVTLAIPLGCARAARWSWCLGEPGRSTYGRSVTQFFVCWEE